MNESKCQLWKLSIVDRSFKFRWPMHGNSLPSTCVCCTHFREDPVWVDGANTDAPGFSSGFPLGHKTRLRIQSCANHRSFWAFNCGQATAVYCRQWRDHPRRTCSQYQESRKGWWHSMLMWFISFFNYWWIYLVCKSTSDTVSMILCQLHNLAWQGLSALEMEVIDLVKDVDHAPEEEEKISSSSHRTRMLGTLLKVTFLTYDESLYSVLLYPHLFQAYVEPPLWSQMCH